MANRVKYGAVWARAKGGGKACPDPERVPIASAYQGAIQGGTNVDLNVGDIVKRLATGYYSIAEGSEITSYNPGTVDADIPFGVIVGFDAYWDGEVMKPTNFLPGATTYGTNFKRQSFAYVVPFNAGIWSIALDATSASFDTYAELLAVVGQNIDIVNSNGVTLKAEPELDLATIADANSLTVRYRIVGLDPSLDNQSFATTSFRLLVQANSYADAPNTVAV